MKIKDLNGLVLAGGKSLRFKEDKGDYIFKNKPQKEFLFELLVPFCNKVYISQNPTQQINDYPVLIDTNSFGPLSGILEAFRKSSTNGWLIVACDFPLIGEKEIKDLISMRDQEFEATCYANGESIEPLFSIWEPPVYHELNNYISQRNSLKSPREFLLGRKTKIAKPNSNEFLFNINSRADLSMYRDLIQS